jgi:hypothetical protein
MGGALTETPEIAGSLGDIEYQLRALRGLYFYHAGSSPYRIALPFAQAFRKLAASGSDSNDRLFGERMLGVAKHFFGDQLGARLHLELVLTHFAENDHGPEVIRLKTDYYIVRLHTDLRISAYVYFARVLWLQGLPDQVVLAAETSIVEAQKTGHALSLCYALGLAAGPIAVWVGNLAAAARYTGMLHDHSRKNNLPLWNAYGSRFHSVVVLRSGGLNPGLQPLHTGRDQVIGPSASFRSVTGLIELAGALANAGRIADGLAIVEAAIEQSEEGWHTSELLRLKASFCCRRISLLLLKRPKTSSGKRSMEHEGKDPCHGSCAWPRASPACCAIKAARPTPLPASSRSTIASRRVSVPPILSRRNSYWTTSALLDTATMQRITWGRGELRS